jgi:hypothetical protein
MVEFIAASAEGAQAAHRALQRGVDLHEHVEDGGEVISGDPDAAVAHPDDGMLPVALDGERARLRPRGITPTTVCGTPLNWSRLPTRCIESASCRAGAA